MSNKRGSDEKNIGQIGLINFCLSKGMSKREAENLFETFLSPIYQEIQKLLDAVNQLNASRVTISIDKIISGNTKVFAGKLKRLMAEYNSLITIERDF